MTKERKAAIQMWEDIVDQLPFIPSVGNYKALFMQCNPYTWENDCWLCQYCRKDYRQRHVGREGLECTANNCESCPLYKYEIARGNTPRVRDACGCVASNWLCDVLWYKVYAHKDVRAAKTILSILKGEEV